MEIYKIKNLKCNKKENRIKLMKAFMKEMKMEEKPNKEKIGKMSKKVEKKYGYMLALFNAKNTIMAVVSKGGVNSHFEVHSLLEAYIKHILIAKELYKNERKVPE